MRKSIAAGTAVATMLTMASLVAVSSPAEAAVGIRVSNGRLYEANGSELVLRGINHAHTWYTSQTSSFANIGATGANSVRTVLSGGRWGGANSASDVSNVISLAKSAKLISVLENHDTTGYNEQSGAVSLDAAVDYWISVKSALVGQEDYVILNIGNEPYGNGSSYTSWTTDTANAIRRLRSAGFQHTIMVDAPNWGQDWGNVMKSTASQVYAADTTGNTVFSIHMYGVYDTASEVTGYVDTFLNAKLPIVVGEFGSFHSDGDPDEDTIMSYTTQKNVGYMGWSWSGNSGGVEYLDLVNSYNPSSLTTWGERFINGSNGIKATSKKATIFGGTNQTTTTTSRATTTTTSNPTTTTTSRATTTTTTTTPDNGTHVDNPYVGKGYVNPQWKALAESVAGGSRVSSNPTAVWLDRIAAIEGTANSQSNGPMGLRDHLDAALAQGATYAQFVIYNLPARDCSALASNGELGIDELSRYKSEYIDAIAAIQADSKYRSLRIINVIEIDSLPNTITNTNVELCAQVKSRGIYVDGVSYALGKLHAAGSNVYNYIDAGHHGWLGWDTNFGPSAELFNSTVLKATGTYATVDGFISNTANYSALSEPYVGDVTRSFNGMPVRSSKWVDWNYYNDESTYVTAFRTKLISLGFPSTIGMLIDTSRNGWGGTNRPTAASSSTTLDTFVNESRIDRRIHKGNWCNQSGAGLGERPTAAPASGIDAYVWIKPPGESDGSSSLIENSDGKGFDRMCDPTYTGNVRNGSSMTGALGNAPISGAWFAAQFAELMANAYPALGSGPTGTTTTTTTTSRPTSTTTTTSRPTTTTTTTSRPTTTTTTTSRPTTTTTTTTSRPTTTTTTTQQPTTTTTTTTSRPTTTTTNGGTKSCSATYAVLGQWPGGFQGDVKVTAGSSAISSWALTWTFADGQTVSQSWSSTLSSSGSAVTASNAPWNGVLGAGASTNFGFIGSWNGSTNSAPTISCLAS